MNSEHGGNGITPTPNGQSASPTGIVTDKPGLPPVQPPSARFIVSLFLVPGLIVLVLVVFYLGWHWLFRGPSSPDEFIKALDDANPEVRWRTAADLAQVLPRDENLRSDPGFALDLSDRLQQAARRIEPLEKARLERIRTDPEASDPDRKALRDERQYLGFLTSCVGNFMVPAGAPLLRDLAISEGGSAEPEEILARRRAAVWALAVLGENVRRFPKLSNERQQAILDRLALEAEALTDRGKRAELALVHLKAVQAGKSSLALGVDGALVETARSDDAFLRKQTALALSYWDGPKVESTLLALLNDDGRSSADAAQRETDGRDVRYNAALSLARRGSSDAAKALDVLREMLDLDRQQQIQKGMSPVEIVIATLKAIGQLRQKNERIDLSSLKPAIDQLAGHDNAAVSTEARQTQLILSGQK